MQHLSIIIDTSRGLAYLHSEKAPVSHHDVNSYVVYLAQCGMHVFAFV